MLRIGVFCLAFFAVLATASVCPDPAASAEASAPPEVPIMNIEGNWFSCEFAHSQIPPEDGCQMFDDDGFAVAKGKISHIKVTNSDQLNCRHERKGQCFERDKKDLVVTRDPVGAIRPTNIGFAVTYWGCTQEYLLQKRDGFFEVSPDGSRCLWTRDKRYFIARYKGPIRTK